MSSVDTRMAVVRRKAIEEALDTHAPEATVQERHALSTFLEQMLDSIMSGERIVHLEDHDDDKGNGHYRRVLASAMGKLRLDVPRTRSGKFRPQVLPEKYQRTTPDYAALLESLAENACSPNRIARILAGLDLPYSEDQMQIIRERLLTRLTDFKTRQLPGQALALVIDGYHTQMKDAGRVKNVVVYLALIITLEGRKEIAGFYPVLGNETKTEWLKIFNDIVTRGLTRTLLVISDDFPGLADAVTAVFSKSDHQLCCLHLMRNARRNMGKVDGPAFIKQLRIILSSIDSFDEARDRFLALCQTFQGKYPTFINPLMAQSDRYVAYKRYPDPIRKYLYTTNPAENINRQIDDVRVTSGGYFQSLEILEIDLYLVHERLRQGVWRRAVPAIAAEQYLIRQLFNLRFSPEEVLQTQHS